MAVIQEKDVTAEATEEARHKVIAEAIVGVTPAIPGVDCVREITPLVMTALQRANNPFITNRKGFEAIGIEFDKKGKQVTDPAAFALAIMPKTAEILVLLSCTREELKRFAVNSVALEDAALDLMEGATMQQLGEATIFVTVQLNQISKARAAKSPEEDKPGAASLEEVTGAKKKPGPTG